MSLRASSSSFASSPFGCVDAKTGLAFGLVPVSSGEEKFPACGDVFAFVAGAASELVEGVGVVDPVSALVVEVFAAVSEEGGVVVVGAGADCDDVGTVLGRLLTTVEYCCISITAASNRT